MGVQYGHTVRHTSETLQQTAALIQRQHFRGLLNLETLISCLQHTSTGHTVGDRRGAEVAHEHEMRGGLGVLEPIEQRLQLFHHLG